MLRFNFAEVKLSFIERFLTLEVVTGLVIFLSIMFFNLYVELSTKSQISEVEEKITNLEHQREILRSLERKQKELRNTKEELEKKLSIVEKLEKDRGVPKFLYFFLEKNNVDDIWLEVLSLKGKKLNIEGNAQNMEKLYRFLKAIELNLGKAYLEDVKLETIPLKRINKKIEYLHFLLSVEIEDGKIERNPG